MLVSWIFHDSQFKLFVEIRAENVIAAFERRTALHTRVHSASAYSEFKRNYVNYCILSKLNKLHYNCLVCTILIRFCTIYGWNGYYISLFSIHRPTTITSMRWTHEFPSIPMNSVFGERVHAESLPWWLLNVYWRNSRVHTWAPKRPQSNRLFAYFPLFVRRFHSASYFVMANTRAIQHKSATLVLRVKRVCVWRETKNMRSHTINLINIKITL